MRFAFREFPAATGGLTTPRPIVDVRLVGLDAGRLACLVDTGALRSRFAGAFAELAGIDGDSSRREAVVIGGVEVLATPAEVSLRLEDVHETYDWDTTVWFCDPWPFPFQLLGLEGFLRHFRLTLSAYEEWLDCVPET